MTRRPPADADEDTLIMRRQRVDRVLCQAPGRGTHCRRQALGPALAGVWLGIVMLLVRRGGLGAWVFRGAQPPAQTIVAVAPPAQQQPPHATGRPRIAAVRGQSSPPPAPHITDARLAEIDGFRHSGTAVYRLVENPRILLIDFPTLAEQGRAMNRLAALIEKSDMPHDRVLSEAEMATAIPNPDTYYFAHDYAATSLARFFSLAEAETQPLNQQERDLLALLVGAHVIERARVRLRRRDAGDGGRHAGPGRRPGMPAGETVDAALRDTMLHHEVSHGEFFTNPAYRAHCERFWRERLSEAERALFRSFLTGYGYDPADETLMINEMQAYLMHTPDPRAFSAALLHVTPEKLAELRRRFMDPQPPTPLLGGKAPAG